MKRINLLILALLFLSITIPAAAETEKNAAAPSGADKVEKIFSEIAANEPGSGPAEYTIQENDFNSWLKKRTRDKEFITDIKAGFQDNNEADLSLKMNLEKNLDRGYYVNMLATMFKGEQHLKASGEIKAGNGKFSFVVNSLTMNEVIVTPALVYPLLKALLPDYELDKPLDLPYGLKDIKTEKGVLKIIR